MATQLNDPAQILAGLFGIGDEQTPQGGATSVASGLPIDPIQLATQYAKVQQEFMNQVTGFWSGLLGVARTQGNAEAAAIEDKRFASEAWQGDPFFAHDVSADTDWSCGKGRRVARGPGLSSAPVIPNPTSGAALVQYSSGA